MTIAVIKIAKTDDWKQIETAPNDGTGCLVYWNDNENAQIRIAFYANDNKWHIACSIKTCNPTHWMPLPKAPK